MTPVLSILGLILITAGLATGYALRVFVEDVRARRKSRPHRYYVTNGDGSRTYYGDTPPQEWTELTDEEQPRKGDLWIA